MRASDTIEEPGPQEFRLVPLGDGVGAEIGGLRFEGPSLDESISTVRRVWREHPVVRLRDLRLDDAALVELTRGLGEPELPPPNDDGQPYVPEHPEVMIISNVEADGRKIGSLGNAEAVWHSDLNFQKEPPAASLLYALEAPAEGGATGFANMYRAYEGLDPELARAVAGRSIRHDGRFNSAGLPRLKACPSAEHPIVRTHPDTGRKCLYLGRRAHAQVVGLPGDESEALLDALWEHAVSPRFVWYQHWKVGDLIIWDNRCMLHRRDSFDAAARRVLHRTQTRGTRPF